MEPPCGGCWSRAGALKDATIMAWSGPPLQPQRSTEPAAYLTLAAGSVNGLRRLHR